MLIYNSQLDQTQLHAVNNLSKLCRAADGGSPPLYPHILEQTRNSDSNVLYFEQDTLIGFLSVFLFYTNACEVSVMVAPSHRRQRIATQLIQTVIPQLLAKQISTLIFSIPTGTNTDWLSRLNFTYRNSEYRMQRNSYEPILITKQALTIRKATTNDLPVLCTIDKLCFSIEHEHDDMIARFNNLLNEINYTVLLALHNEKVVGKAHLRWETENAILSDLAIIPSCQRQGLGSELLANCINHALSRGTTKLVLDVETSNTNALNLYLRHDFKTINAIDYWAIDTDKLRTLLEQLNPSG